ncbi:MAG: ACT domain-containing protein [Candidatus Binataceae bacterium]
MTPNSPEPLDRSIAPERGAILRLLVRNHFGVMTHVCSLFSRRAFNLDAIICLPTGDGAQSVVALIVNEDERLDQLIRQLGKLEDVLDVQRAPELRATFESLAHNFG